ncbi:MAG: hypothetical protein LYZ69_09395 [Nitrososphaerales archaeon]|nr:hypothetical protein [Nitrososphaerales archaeon]
MYPDRETEFSRRYLKNMLSVLPDPYCLMGGWSVYLTLKERFRETTGREYPGSRDIDLGFHLDPKWKPREFEGSAFGKAIKKIRTMGFEPESFRFVKRYHLWEERELTPEEERSLPQYDIFNLYLDVLVDTKDPKRFKVARFKVLEEPLLAKVFSGTGYVKTDLDGVSVTMPAPQLLMEMKVKSFPGRTQDDKRTKDLIDLCALVLYSGVRPPLISATAAGKRRLERFERAVDDTKEEEWNGVAAALDVSASVAKRTASSVK